MSPDRTPAAPGPGPAAAPARGGAPSPLAAPSGPPSAGGATTSHGRYAPPEGGGRPGFATEPDVAAAWEAHARAAEAELDLPGPRLGAHASVAVAGAGRDGASRPAGGDVAAPQTEVYSQRWAVVFDPDSRGDEDAARARRAGDVRGDGHRAAPEGGAARDGASPAAFAAAAAAPVQPAPAGAAAGGGPVILPGPVVAPRGDGEGGAAYVLRRCVGQGGFGEVWEAEQRALARLVAVKKIRDDAYEEVAADVVRRRMLEADFRQEALTTGLLDHPNIVPVYDLGEDAQGRPLLAMKLIEGQSWDKLIREDWRPLAVPEFLEKHLPILVDVGQAVAFAHSRGIVHRDIKPGQVMVGQFGEVLLTDWGLSLSLRATPPPGMPVMPALPTRDTATNPAGTPSLMAPEQTQPTAAGVGIHTDIYLLGGTLYYLLTGHFPHSAGDSERTMERARSGDVTPPEERNPRREVPGVLGALAMRCMAREPRDRPSSALEFVEVVQGYLTGASRRREAQRIVEEVAARYEEEKGEPSYEWLGQSLTRLEQATAMWPSNPELPALDERVRGAFAALTLASGDLTLAHHLIETMPPGTERTRLRARLDRREALEAARRRRHKAALAGSFALLVLMLLGAGMFTLRLMAQREEIEARRREAVAESERARREQQRAEVALAEAERRREEVEEGKRLLEGTLAEARRQHEAATASVLEAERIIAMLLRELGVRIDSTRPEDAAMIDVVIGAITEFEDVLRERLLLESSPEAAARLDLLESGYRDWTVRTVAPGPEAAGEAGATGGAEGEATGDGSGEGVGGAGEAEAAAEAEAGRVAEEAGGEQAGE